jgi:hypothetical protein
MVVYRIYPGKNSADTVVGRESENAMSSMRWCLIAPIAIAVWYVVFVLGLFTHSFVESYFCPPKDLISGFCVNSTVQAWLRFLVHAFVAVSALAVEAVTVVVAPKCKKSVAWLTLASGMAVAAYFASETDEWVLFASACVGGFAGLLAVTLWLRRPVPNNALQATCEDARA